MKYINKKTKAVIDVDSKVSGENWEPFEEVENDLPEENEDVEEE